MDQWGPPKKEHWSDNRQFVLRIRQGKKGYDYDLALYNRAGRCLWVRPSPQLGAAPLRALVRDDGQYVVLCDVHGGSGYGTVLVFIDASGTILKRYSLNELLIEEQVSHAFMSESSIGWCASSRFSFLEKGSEFGFIGYRPDVIGAFSVTSGLPLPLTEARRSQLGEVVQKETRRLLATTGYRCSGLQQIAIYRLTQLLPEVQKSLKSSGDEWGCAVMALAQLQPREAISLILSALAKRPRQGQDFCLAALGSIDRDENDDFRRPRIVPESALILAAWHQLAQSKDQRTHEQALKALCERETPAYLRSHPERLRHPNKDVRYLYIRNLTHRGEREALPLLRKALTDSESANRLWAFRGLVTYKSPELLTICRKAMRDSQCGYDQEALIELATRRDPEGTKLLMQRLPTNLSNFACEEACLMIAQQNRTEFLAALQALHKKGSPYVERSVIGALAVLGSKAAGETLLKDLTRGSPYKRVQSIQYAGLARDPRANATLQAALKDREPTIREAAQKWGNTQ